MQVTEQVHMDLLTDRVWLFLTLNTATAKTAASNFVSLVFSDVGRPDDGRRARLAPRHVLYERFLDESTRVAWSVAHL